MKKVLGMILLLAAGLVLAEPLGAAKFSGRLLKMTAVTKSDEIALNLANQWKTVPGMTVDFTTTKAGAAVAVFCGAVSTSDSNGQVFLRLWEVGVGDWEPGSAEFDTKAFYFKTRCFSWFATLPPGTYKIKAQWIGTNPNSGFVNKRSLRVHHEK